MRSILEWWIEDHKTLVTLIAHTVMYVFLAVKLKNEI
jgi:hypothetical protein